MQIAPPADASLLPAATFNRVRKFSDQSQQPAQWTLVDSNWTMTQTFAQLTCLYETAGRFSHRFDVMIPAGLASARLLAPLGFVGGFNPVGVDGFVLFATLITIALVVLSQRAQTLRSREFLTHLDDRLESELRRATTPRETSGSESASVQAVEYDDAPAVVETDAIVEVEPTSDLLEEPSTPDLVVPLMERSWLRSKLPATCSLAAGLSLLVLANSALNDQRMSVDVGLALGAGLSLVCTAVLAYGDNISRSIEPARQENRERSRLFNVFLTVAVVAAAGAWHWSSENRFRAPGIVCWLVAVLAWIVAWWPRGSATASAFVTRAVAAGRRIGPPRAAVNINVRSLVIGSALLAILALGGYFRFAHIDETPRDPTSDHAEKLLDVHDLLEGARPIYFERNTGREPLQFYLTFGLIRVFGLSLSFTSLKIGTAFIGLASVPFVYLLAKELAGSTTGLLAATLYAAGKWPVAISRAGLRFPYGSLFAAAVLWLFLRWMRTRDRRDALFCGLALGAGLYGYTPFRVVVPAVALGVLITLLCSRSRRERSSAIQDGILIATTAFMVFIPLGHYAFERPDMFWFRASNRIAGDNGDTALGALWDKSSVFARNLLNAALGFNWKGDSTIVNGVSYDPMLDVITGALLLAGILVVAMAIVRSRDPRAIFLVLAVPVLTLSSTLALSFPIENPSVNREGPVAPLMFAIAAIPGGMLLNRLRAALGQSLGIGLGTALVGLALWAVVNENHEAYFGRFDAQYSRTVANTTEIARAIDQTSAFGVEIEDAYVIDSPYWLDIRNIGIALGDISWGPRHNVQTDAAIPAQPAGRPLIFVIRYGDDRLAEVVRLYPSGRLFQQPTEVQSQSFLLYWVPAVEPG